MKQIAFMILKPLLLKWLDERALRLPMAKMLELSKTTGADYDTVTAIETMLRQNAIQQIDSVLK